MSELRWLGAGATLLDDSAIPHIVANFKKLRRFDFDGTKVTQEGMMKLAELPWLLTIAMPKEAFHGDKAERKAARREFCLKYIDAYKKSKAKARAAGIDVPDKWQTPFGGVE